MAGNWYFGPRKAPRKSILTMLHNLAIFSKKQKKSYFGPSKSMKKIFPRRIFRPMWTGHQSNTRDQYILFPPPNPYNLDVCTPALPTYMYPPKLAFKSKKALFSRKCCFCCFCCVLGVAFVVFQNLVNQEMLLPIFIFLIRRLVKKLFHFEVMFR